MSSTPRYPRGNPLTESMPFTDRDGGRWLVYIEGVLEPRLYWGHRATLPARRLRFDSAAESRVTTELPAGSPFLAEARLQDLLDQAEPVSLSLPSRWQPVEAPVHARRSFAWVRWAGKVGGAALADAQRILAESLGSALTLVARIAAGRHSTLERRGRGAQSHHRLGPR